MTNTEFDVQAPDNKEKLARLRQYIDASRYTVFFGGAGVSTESGVLTLSGEVSSTTSARLVHGVDVSAASNAIVSTAAAHSATASFELNLITLALVRISANDSILYSFWL